MQTGSNQFKLVLKSVDSASLTARSYVTKTMSFYYCHVRTVTLVTMQHIPDDMVTTSKICIIFVKCDRVLTETIENLIKSVNFDSLSELCWNMSSVPYDTSDIHRFSTVNFPWIVKNCVKKLLSMDNYFNYVCKHYYPQIVDSTIYEALDKFT